MSIDYAISSLYNLISIKDSTLSTPRRPSTMLANKLRTSSPRAAIIERFLHDLYNLPSLPIETNKCRLPYMDCVAKSGDHDLQRDVIDNSCLIFHHHVQIDKAREESAPRHVGSLPRHRAQDKRHQVHCLRPPRQSYTTAHTVAHVLSRLFPYPVLELYDSCGRMDRLSGELGCQAC